MDPTDPTNPAALMLGAPMNILPPAQMQPAQRPGILNGQQAPNSQLMQQAMKMMQPQQQMQPIPMAQPVGSMGIDPTKLLAAMQQNKLMNA